MNKDTHAGEIDLLVGDADGFILLYHDIISSFVEADNYEISNKPSPRKLHWHRGPVSAVRWSRDGMFPI